VEISPHAIYTSLATAEAAKHGDNRFPGILTSGRKGS